MSLLKWVNDIADSQSFTVEGVENLIQALAVAVEALETAEFNYEIDRGSQGICGRALAQIEAMGEGK